MKSLILLLSFISLSPCLWSQEPDTLRRRLIFVGDAGELHNGHHPVVDWLKKNVDWNDERNTLIYLGDNIYPYGLPSIGEEGYEESKEILDYQIDLVKDKKARGYFIPGNHDWFNGKIGGWQRVMNQVNYINSLGENNIEAWPREGCPGPIEIDLDSQVVVVLMDSHWFLHVHEKPGPGSACESKTFDDFMANLRDIAERHPNQMLVLAMHHPMYSQGVHGGAYGWRQHIFPLVEAWPKLYIPLPILGSIYPVARGIFGNVQDVNHPAYRAMAKEIEGVIKRHPNAVSVAGHDHSLQLLEKDSVSYIVSGSGAPLSRVRTNGKYLQYADVNNGFVTIEIWKSGKAETRFYNIQSTNLATPNYTKALKTIVKTLPPSTMDTLLPLPDSVVTIADINLRGNGMKHILQGRNYRKEWTQPVRVEVLDIAKEQGGLKPIRRGGGKQTRSLRLEDKNGKEWVLRSIQKFPEAAVPPDLRQTVAKDIVQDGVSASYPYAALSISHLNAAAGIPTLRRKLVYVPDDPRLDRFREDFRNDIAILEEREPVNVKKTDNTEEIVLKLMKDNDDHVDQARVLKARLMDNFIMDFDRHEDQWRWATYDTGKGKMYYPIPRDHDQAFFVSEGIIPRFVRKPWFLPEVQGFRFNAKNINTFNRPARNFDRFFLTELSADHWEKAIDSFLNFMTDGVIEKAMYQQPREIHGYEMNTIINKLKKRKDFFRKDMMQYYSFISREVAVVGSNQRELFTVKKLDDGKVHVLVNKIDKDSNVVSLIYDRVFDPAVTEELQLYGLESNDRFVFEGGKSPIKIRVVGGPGNDEFINNGTGGKLLVYDAAFEENKLLGNVAGFRNEISLDPDVNRYNRNDYKYDFVNPGVSVDYNVDDGLYLGAQIEFTEQAFRKDPYKMRNFVDIKRAVNTGSLRFRYEGDFIKLIGHHDLIVRADIRAPVNVTNFFGLGNETVFDKLKPGRERYYRVRYDYTNVSLLLRRQMQSWMRIHYGTNFEFFRVERDQNQGKFVSEVGWNGSDPANLYESRMFVGGHFKLDIDSRNNKVIPTRGFTLDLNIKPILGLNEHSNNIAKMDADMRIYASLFSLPRLVLATRLGYGRIFGDFAFPQAYYLSGVENLRGWRRDRFAGRTMLYNNTELRFKVMEFSTYLFPGQLGVHVFNDVGRVWMDRENSTDWKVGNGLGLWVAPIKRFVVTGSLTFSKEERGLPFVTFGYHF